MKFDVSMTNQITPEITSYIQKAIDETPVCVDTIEEVMYGLNTGKVSLFTIKLDDELYGVMVAGLMRKDKNYFNIIYLSGKDIKLWKDEFQKWVISTIKTLDATLVVIGRKGWDRVFPVLKEVGSIFTLE